MKIVKTSYDECVDRIIDLYLDGVIDADELTRRWDDLDYEFKSKS